jgi:hypothetical protein
MTSTNIRKAKQKALKAVAQVDQCVNHLNEHNVYNIEKARRRAKSYRYWMNVARG